MARQTRWSTLSLGTFLQILYLLGVIVFGAFVRASGSGAGCGSHWPLCNGVVVPHEPALQTIIEYTHRLSSSLTLPIALLILWLAWRRTGKGHRLRKAALVTILLVISEGLVGAGLVLFEHVADNRSQYRGVSMGLHLVNTFALIAAAAVTWYWSLAPQLAAEQGAFNHKQIKGENTHKSPRATRWLLASGFAALVVLGISGAITALGDTLFPVASRGEAWQLAASTSEHLFIRLRVYHPFIAVVVGAYLVFLARFVSKTHPHARRLALTLSALVLIQLVLGLLNVELLAPIWLQLVHLLTAELIWIVYVVFVAHALNYSRKNDDTEALVGLS